MISTRPLVTIDMDGVLCHPPLGLNPGTGQGKRRDTPGKRGVLWRTERLRYLGRKPMPGALEGFLALQKRFDCVVVSARSEVARKPTEAWFERYFGFCPTVNLRLSWEETSAQYKARRVVELGAAAHIEDDPHTAEWLAELLQAVCLVDWPRNTWLQGDRIHRISGIGEASRVLTEALSDDSKH